MVQTTKAGSLRSGALAKATGVSPDTIRHYERIGILPKPPRAESGYRIYPQGSVERVRTVQNALRIGFTLAELADVLKAGDAGRVPCQRVHQLAKEKLAGIRTDIRALQRTEKYLESVLSHWEDRLRSAGPGQKSHLLRSLESQPALPVPDNKFRRRRRP